jgi:hypothetical protein
LLGFDVILKSLLKTKWLVYIGNGYNVCAKSMKLNVFNKKFEYFVL